ncbi:hypothetical protein FACS189476_12100 [Spirochaetia bacterium]|nr:hypothetical protein FACS189476_12100 [Spirochaetia bacterium]
MNPNIWKELFLWYTSLSRYALFAIKGNMRILKAKWFTKFADKAGITADLIER